MRSASYGEPGERDFETGLDYFGARHYQALWGRFTTIDPVYTWEENLVDPQRWNRYSYVRNNPLRWVDPDGRMALPLITAAVGAIVYAAWNAYLNVERGDPWHKNAGVEASKGLLVGATLGAAGPALVSPPLQLGAGAAVAAGEVVRSSRPAIVIGENMRRVGPYAKRIGAEVYGGMPGFKAGMEAQGLAHNRAFILEKMAQGYRIIDIGPDFARRAITGTPSAAYEMERQLTKGYLLYQKAFSRAGTSPVLY